MPKASKDNNTQVPDTTAISVRHVDRKIWKDMRKLAVLYDMGIADLIKYLVEKEMKDVQIQISPDLE